MKVSINKKFALMIKDTPALDEDLSFQNELIEKIPTAKWHAAWRCWYAPLGLGACRSLKSMGADFEKHTADWLKTQEAYAESRRRAEEVKAMRPDDARAALLDAGVRFKMAPFDHQVVSLAFAMALPACGLFLDTGTGKTCVGAMLMQALVDLFGKGRFLVVAPKTLLDAAWGVDIDKFSWLTWTNLNKPQPVDTCPVCDKVFSGGVVTWAHLRGHMKVKIRTRAGIDIDMKTKDMTPAQKEFLKQADTEAMNEFYKRAPQFKPKAKAGRVERIGAVLNSTNANVYIINPESFKLAFDEIAAHKWDGVIIDESSILKNPTSAISEKMIRFGMEVKRKVIMTATPRPNNSLEWWAQMAFLDMCLGSSFSAYRSKFFVQAHYSEYVWLAKPGADRKIKDIVFKRSIRYRLDDCVDLPGENYETHFVDLGKDCRDHYEQMKEEMFTSIDGEMVTSANNLVKINKLSQIASGFIFDEEKNAHVLGESIHSEHRDMAKIDATCEIARRLIEQEGHGSVVIWIRFSKIESRLIEEKLKDLGVSTAHGHTKNIDKSVGDFKSGRTKIMIAHPQSVMFGHTWTHCSVAIFCSVGHSWEQFYQSKRRIYRISQTKPVLYINIVARDTVDEEIVKAITGKERSSEEIIDNIVHDIRG